MQQSNQTICPIAKFPPLFEYLTGSPWSSPLQFQVMKTMKPTPKITMTDYATGLDQTVHPQDNFFGYVNNRWLEANPIPLSESRWGTFNVLRDQAWKDLRDIYEELGHAPELRQASIEQQARDLYDTAMHADKFEQAHLELLATHCRRIEDITNTSELSRCIGELQAVGINGPWRVIVDIDDKDSSSHILRLRQGGLTLPDREYYLGTSSKMKDVRKKYDAHLQEVEAQFATLSKNGEKFSARLIEFETEIAKHSRTNDALREVEENYHKTSYAELRSAYPNINWAAFAEGLGWRPDDKITVDQPEFLECINGHFTDSKLAIWKTYLKWQLLVMYMGKISERFAKLQFTFFGVTLNGTKEIQPQWKRAVLLIEGLIGPGVGKIYAERHFPESSKKQVLELVEQIRESYRQRIKRLDWMTEKTKQHAFKKLANIKVLIGYPDKWRDFSKLEIGRTSYIANIMAAEKFQSDYYLHHLHEPTSRDEWFMNPQTVNAYSDVNRLVICFPAAILQAPFFSPDAPLAANLGGIGSVIGHEFTHGFDDQGYKFDAQGNLRAWQSKADREQFTKRAQVIIDQADAFEVVPGVNLTGKLVVGESIADLGGVEIAFDALRSSGNQEAQGKLSVEQLFFVAYATTECATMREEKKREFALIDPHPDSIFRVNGILAHIDAFYKAFHVTRGNTLFRPQANRARIW